MCKKRTNKNRSVSVLQLSFIKENCFCNIQMIFMPNLKLFFKIYVYDVVLSDHSFVTTGSDTYKTAFTLIYIELLVPVHLNPLVLVTVLQVTTRCHCCIKINLLSLVCCSVKQELFKLKVNKIWNRYFLNIYSKTLLFLKNVICLSQVTGPVISSWIYPFLS